MLMNVLQEPHWRSSHCSYVTSGKLILKHCTLSFATTEISSSRQLSAKSTRWKGEKGRINAEVQETGHKTPSLAGKNRKYPWAEDINTGVGQVTVLII